MNQIEELIDLLLSPYNVENKQEIITACTRCYENPGEYLANNDAEWLQEVRVAGEFEYAVTNELYDFLITGDKLDEVHELIDDQYEGEIGDFPEHVQSTTEYFIWLHEKLSEMEPAEAIIEIGDSYSDQMQLITVYENDVERIKALCLGLNVHCKRTTYQ